MKPFLLLSFVLAMSIGSSLYAASTKKVDPKEVATAQQRFIQSTSDSLAECSKAFRVYVVGLEMLQMMEDAQDRLDESNLRLGIAPKPRKPNEPAPLIHAQCAERKKSELMPNAKEFIGSFKAKEQQTGARGLVAQWMTAMDSIGTNVSNQESAKYQTLANGLKIDLY